MDKILIFTNPNSFEGLNDTIKNQFREFGQYPSSSNPIMVYEDAPQKTLKKAESFAEKGVYLVFDEIDQNKLNELLQNCGADNLFILTHTKGIKPVFFTSLNNYVSLEGNHVDDSLHYYSPLFSILVDNEPDKTNRIIKEIFKPSLELVLHFLHDCLCQCVIYSNSDFYKWIMESLPGNNEAKNILNNYANEAIDYKIIENLRDQLLDYALTNN